jgi:2-C-methyl-D-erythritol 4-phosphate cytidylyltransferase
MRVSAIVVAAGSGQRLRSDIPKAFVPIAGHPMLYYSMRTIAAVPSIVEAVVAVPAGMEAQAREVTNASGLLIPVKLSPGGAQRQDSVRIALALTSAESELIIVHDAARPFAARALFEACIETIEKKHADGAIAAVAVSDTLKRVEDKPAVGSESKLILATVPRGGLCHAQTPQAFRRELLIEAHRRAERAGITATDDADLVESTGARVAVVEGSPANLKITTLADLELAETLALSRPRR